jgi:RNA polymerase sigma-70 factor (ECF subfamily)
MDEQELIQGCLRGSPVSCRTMVESYGNLVMSVALNVVGNRQDAEDVCQETFLQIFRHLDRYDPARSFKTWLLTIVYRRSLDMIKKKRRFSEFSARARFEPAVAERGGIPHPADPGPLPSALLKGLSPRERTALCLWANEGYTAKDISEVLACSASTARVYLFNARRKIKTLLENDHGLLQNS